MKKLTMNRNLILVLITAITYTFSIKFINAQTCTWIGNTPAWDNPANWVNGIPTNVKTAIIPVVSPPFVYPVIKQNVNAQCKALIIKDNGIGNGAHLSVNATDNASLAVVDSIVIGDGVPSGTSTSFIKINSINNPVITLPPATSIPPAGLALATITPFRSIAQCKTQISYTAAELVNNGWESGTTISALSVLVNSISPAPPGPVIFQNFRIMAYLTSTAVTYPFPLPMNTKAAVMPGDANVIAGWPKLIYSNDTLTLNMPNSSGGTIANGNYKTLNLIPNSLIWDGVSNLVLSFEFNSTSGTAPMKNYIMYDESSANFSCISINYNVVGTSILGYNLTGAGSYSGGTNPGITATVSNQRPRIDFTIFKIYQPFPITVGNDWINNNGTNGFKAGNSIVSMIGFYSKISGETVFNKLVIDKGSNTIRVRLHDNCTVDSALSLNKGKFELNNKTLIINNSDANAINRINGFILSESSNQPYGIISWKIDSNYAQHIYPFATISGIYIPFNYKQMSGNAGYVNAATYKTAINNIPYPAGVTNINDTNSLNNKDYTVDRFWILSRTGTTGNAQLKFSYKNTEAPLPITPANLEANWYDSTSDLWQRFSNPQTNNSGAKVSNVVINNVASAKLSSGVWALSDSSHPLRIKDETSDKVSVFPNPFTEFIVIDATESNCNYFIYNTSMQLIASGNIAAGNSINTSNLLPGFYTLYLKCNGADKQYKLVKF